MKSTKLKLVGYLKYNLLIKIHYLIMNRNTIFYYFEFYKYNVIIESIMLYVISFLKYNVLIENNQNFNVLIGNQITSIFTIEAKQNRTYID